MKITEYSEKVREFQKMHPDLPRASEGGVVIYQFEIIDGSVKLAIDVSDFSTHQDLRDAIPLAMEWRNRLIQFQGVTGLFTEYEFLKLLYNMTESIKGVTDRNVVDVINFKLHNYWLECVSKSHISVEGSPFTSVFEFIVTAVENEQVHPMAKVKSMLTMFRLDIEEIDLACNEGIKIAESSNPVYPLEFPLTYSKYKSTKRWWKTRQK